MSQPSSVKAVGFAYFSPEAFVLVANHKQDHIHLFPAKSTSQPLKLQREKRRQVVALRALEKLNQLAPHVDDIGLVVAFGDASDLIDLGVPLMDAEVNEEGKIVGRPRQSRDELLDRINREAVDLKIDVPLSSVKLARKKAAESASYTGPTFRQQMLMIRDAIQEAGKKDKFVFANEAAVPSILRLMGDTPRDDFKSACQGMITRGGVPEDLVKAFFKWVEGIDGIGPELGKAVDLLLYSDDDVVRTEHEVAEQYGVDEKDVTLVANSYQQLTADEEAEEGEEK